MPDRFEDIVIAAVTWREWMHENPDRMQTVTDWEAGLLAAIDAAFGSCELAEPEDQCPWGQARARSMAAAARDQALKGPAGPGEPDDIDRLRRRMSPPLVSVPPASPTTEVQAC